MAFNDIFKALKKGRLPSDEEIKKIPSFMFCRYLGTNAITIAPANVFNVYHKQIPMTLQYKMIKEVFAGKGIYPKLLKKLTKEDENDALCTHFNISRERAKEYKQFLTQEEFNEIKEMYVIKG